MKFQCLLTASILVSLTACGGRQLKDYPITVEVIDDYGVPVSNATVHINFDQSRFRGDTIEVDGFTNSNGVFSVTNKSVGLIGVQVVKDGFYSWSKPFHFYISTQTSEMVPFDPSEDPAKVILKRVENPIPMYVKRFLPELPKTGVPVAYDLMVGDWVKPHGKGTNEDFIFHADYNTENHGNYHGKITLTFSNEGDGIQEFQKDSSGSKLKSAKLSPESGYQSTYNQIREKKDGKLIHNERSEGRCFYFRIRTILDEDGNVVSAMHGKIEGDSFITSSLRYYLNPDRTRNIEFDSNQNLFPEDNGFEQ